MINFKEKFFRERVSVTVAIDNISEIEISWIAGFLEGEGTFSFQNNYKYVNICACQVNREPLEKLQKFLGGSISIERRYRSGNAENGGYSEIYRWMVSGNRARSLCRLIYKYMSEKRKRQIDRIIYEVENGI